MNEKIEKVIIICICLLCFGMSYFLSGCKSLPRDTDIIAEHYRVVGQLEATTDSIDTIIGDCSERIESITEASREIEDGIERTIYLFREYDSLVRELLRDLTELQNQIKEQSNSNNSSSNNISISNSNKSSYNDTENKIQH